jgi:hypothetical protein
MPTIVAEECDIVLQCGCGNEEVHVANNGTRSTKPTPLSAKKACGFFIQSYDHDAIQKVIQFSFAFLGITGIVHTLVQFGECHDRKTKPFWMKGF